MVDTVYLDAATGLDATGPEEDGGAINLTAGAGGADNGAGGLVYIRGGSALGGDNTGGSVTLASGDGHGGNSSGDITLQCAPNSFAGGRVWIKAGHGNGEVAGSVNITCGNAISGDADGGDIILSCGAGSGAGRSGLIIIFPDLPSSDPAVYGALWNDGGTVKVSAGEG